MCGRYTTPEEGEIAHFFDEWQGEKTKPSFNVAPQTRQPIVVGEAGKKIGMLARWGLIPHWAKDTKIGYKTINARSETAHEKPSFRTAFKKSRCLIPASGWYEWQKLPSGKQPYYFHDQKNRPFCFAGLHSRWSSPDGEAMRTYTILTRPASESLQTIHHRMPVIFPDDMHDAWLDPALDDVPAICELLDHAIEDFEAYPVSQHVNNPKNNDPGCIEPQRPVN